MKKTFPISICLFTAVFACNAFSANKLNKNNQQSYIAPTNNRHKVSSTGFEAKKNNNYKIYKSKYTKESYNKPSLPLTLTVNHGTRGQETLALQYAEAWHKNFGVSAITKLADDKYALGSTLGFNLSQQSRIKFSVNYLNRSRDFNFEPDTYIDYDEEWDEEYVDESNVDNSNNSDNGGEVVNATKVKSHKLLRTKKKNAALSQDEDDTSTSDYTEDYTNSALTLEQYSYGVKYQYLPPRGPFKNFTLGAYYSDTPSKIASKPNYIDNYIAGAKVRGISVGTDIPLFHAASLGATVYYDSINYNTFFDTTKRPNSEGWGFALGFSNTCSERFKISAGVDNRIIGHSYRAGISWLPPILNGLGTEITLNAQHAISYGQRRYSDGLGLQFKFNFTKDRKYSIAPSNSNKVGNVGSWASSSAIDMSNTFILVEK